MKLRVVLVAGVLRLPALRTSGIHLLGASDSTTVGTAFASVNADCDNGTTV
jgi:hypothetical protein